MDYSSERHHGCRILEYTHRGLKFISMENELLALRIIPDKGSDLVELRYKPLDLDFMWVAPNSIREPGKQLPSIGSGLGSYLDNLLGGWQEILPGGGPDTCKGAEVGLHGEVTTLPWNYFVEEDSAAKVAVVFSCRTVRFPFHLRKRISLEAGSTVVSFEEWVTNESDEDLEYLWGQHPVFGPPFISEDCRLDIPAKEFATSSFFNSPTALFKPEHAGPWPVDTGLSGEQVDLSRVPSAAKPVSDLYYLKGLEEGWYAITNTKLNLGFGLCWDVAVFPYMTSWQVFGGGWGYPWYGRATCMSLEIWNGFTDKLKTARANGTLRTLKGRETVNTCFKAVIYRDVERVRRITREGAVQ